MVFKQLLLLLFPLFMLGNAIIAQNKNNPYDLPIVDQVENYITEIKLDSNNLLVNLRKIDTSLYFDIKYASKNNFTGEVVYESPGAFARMPVAKALKQANSQFQKQGYCIVVFDAYRPYRATLSFWDIVADKRYVASPKQGSRHNRGCAIDLSLVYCNSGEALEMPTQFDDFSEAAHPDFMNLPEDVIKNRSLLIKVMRENGFDVFHSEWWHFDFIGWENYSLINLTFDALENVENDFRRSPRNSR